MQVFKVFMKILRSKIGIAMMYLSIFLSIGIASANSSQEQADFTESRAGIVINDLDKSSASEALCEYLADSNDVTYGAPDDKEILENCLKSYQDDFEERFIKEFSYQFKVQKTLCTLSDDDLDYFFEKLKEKEADKLISEYGDMDNQSILVKEFLKRGLVLTLLPAIHKRELAKIWLL